MLSYSYNKNNWAIYPHYRSQQRMLNHCVRPWLSKIIGGAQHNPPSRTLKEYTLHRLLCSQSTRAFRLPSWSHWFYSVRVCVCVCVCVWEREREIFVLHPAGRSSQRTRTLLWATHRKCIDWGDSVETTTEGVGATAWTRKSRCQTRWLSDSRDKRSYSDFSPHHMILNDHFCHFLFCMTHQNSNRCKSHANNKLNVCVRSWTAFVKKHVSCCKTKTIKFKHGQKNPRCVRYSSSNYGRFFSSNTPRSSSLAHLPVFPFVLSSLLTSMLAPNRAKQENLPSSLCQ